MSVCIFSDRVFSVSVCVFAATEEELGSSEESGKDWDELEEEARRGESPWQHL